MIARIPGGTAFARLVLALTGLALLAAAPAQAREATLVAPGVADRSCTGSRGLDGSAVATERIKSPTLSAVTARLRASSGDWDLAVLDAESGRVVAGAASKGARETAEGYVRGGQSLLVKACRRSGSDSSAALTVDFTKIPRGEAAPIRMVKVFTPDDAAERRLQALGLDLTEHGGPGYISVLLHSAADGAALRSAGLDYQVQVPDLVAAGAEDRAADRRFARRVQRSALPSGHTTYRRLFDYQEEMKKLVEQNPGLVAPLTLNHETYEGRMVEGIEITTDVASKHDGKPVFLQMGAHHAREWPSSEHAMEWAYELIEGYKSGDAKFRGLVESTRTIVIPVVNPDGFNASREAGELLGHGNGQSGDDIQNFATSPNEYRRKNCRFLDDSEGGDCTQPSVGLAEPGVDPNRNYGGFWGGPGASSDPTAQDYRGPGPFSEPESQNIRELVSRRQVVTLITNHTFSDLVLRPPGIAKQGKPVDEPIYKLLGDAMALENGYTSQPSYKLYDTTGTTEDWSYYATGGLGFTFEIGCNAPDPAEPNQNCIGNFHPPFAEMVGEYEGTSPAAEAVGGDGNRAAYTIAQQSTADPDRHSVLTGDAPPGAVLKLEKSFQTPTSPQPDPDGGEPQPILLDDKLSTKLVVGDSGKYEWHINPSTRPLVAQTTGRNALGAPSAPETFSGTPATTTPCGDFETTDPTCWNDHPFTIPGGDGVDNESATVSIGWTSPVSDWDMKVFRDVDGDGTSINETSDDEVGQSAQGAPATQESTTFVEPETGDGRLAPGDYVIRVINFAAVDPYEGEISYAGPEEFKAGDTETWQLTCSVGGEVGATQSVLIERGESERINLDKPCVRGLDLSCRGRQATVAGTKNAEKLRGTKGPDVIVAQGGNDDIHGRGGNDFICGAGGKDEIKGGGGKDRIKGEGGRDKVAGGKGRDVVKGGKSRDKVRGSKGRDKLDGGKGKDRLRGGKGRDKLKGKGGRDKLGGGKGKDKLGGGGGRDKLNGGKGRDKLNGGRGRDRCSGGKGRDRNRSC